MSSIKNKILIFNCYPEKSRKNFGQVTEYTQKLKKLHKEPESSILGKELDIGVGVLDPKIREQELRNWLEFI